jgi:hypothetical protein
MEDRRTIFSILDLRSSILDRKSYADSASSR